MLLRLQSCIQKHLLVAAVYTERCLPTLVEYDDDVSVLHCLDMLESRRANDRIECRSNIDDLRCIL